MSKKVFTAFVVISGIIYSCILYHMLFRGFGRENVLLSDNMKINYSYNLIPFKTIGEFIKAFADGNMRGHALRNLFGNLLLLFPLGFYLPFFSRKLAKLRYFMPVEALLIIAIEIGQLLSKTGTCDIDDFILNFAGGILGLLVCKLTFIRLF